jgi:hypothetical protein
MPARSGLCNDINGINKLFNGFVVLTRDDKFWMTDDSGVQVRRIQKAAAGTSFIPTERGPIALQVYVKYG